MPLITQDRTPLVPLLSVLARAPRPKKCNARFDAKAFMVGYARFYKWLEATREADDIRKARRA